jgi:hypothetical protein
MDGNDKEQIRLHSSGATVRHTSKFENLISYKNCTELTSEFLKKWVKPFYMELGKQDNTVWIEDFKKINKEITPEITLTLLGEFNWRTRLVGAYFSTIKGYENQIDIIGVHFLKSEVCCVGHIYAIVLAFYNNEKTYRYLTEYLDYYLQKPNLDFDQKYALGAIAYLDKINGTKNAQHYLSNWIKLQEERTTLSKQENLRIIELLEKQEGKKFAEDFLKATSSKPEIKTEIDLEITYIELQVQFLSSLKNLNE